MLNALTACTIHSCDTVISLRTLWSLHARAVDFSLRLFEHANGAQVALLDTLQRCYGNPTLFLCCNYVERCATAHTLCMLKSMRCQMGFLAILPQPMKMPLGCCTDVEDYCAHLGVLHFFLGTQLDLPKVAALVWQGFYLWPLKMKHLVFFLVWSQSQFYLWCAYHLRLKKLLSVYTWDNILISEFVWQLMASIPQPWSFTWKLELWHLISSLVLFQKVYMRIRWEWHITFNTGEQLCVCYQVFFTMFFPLWRGGG